MEIRDMAGKIFTINDVENTIAIVEEFLNYKPTVVTDSLQRLDEQRLLYWNDFYAKLLKLKNAENGDENIRQ